MAFIRISKILEFIFIYGYPVYKVSKTSMEGKPEKLWIIYFLILAIISLTEGNLLFPIVCISGKISEGIYPFLKTCFVFWLYYPGFKGALLFDQLFGKYIDLVFLKLNPIIGRIFRLFGIPNRDRPVETKKND